METPQITSDPAVMMSKPVIAGTRLTVELILEELAAGTTPAQLIASYPRLPPRVSVRRPGLRGAGAASRCRLPRHLAVGINLLADKCVPSEVVVRRRSDGHAVEMAGG